ncbi:MAG: hypothetical protein C0622_12035 [Desulfuromonas sp.]|nr:MAG: hypothetical protein C0622_12035 [Desulfuromonas sp.]
MLNLFLMRKSKQNCSSTNSKGYTLLELLTVFVIISALTLIIVPTYFSYIDSAKVAVACGTLEACRKDLDLYYFDNFKYPDAIDFSTGLDGNGRTVFHVSLLDQIRTDLAVVVEYTTGVDTYTLKVRANNRDQTLITATPRTILY